MLVRFMFGYLNMTSICLRTLGVFAKSATVSVCHISFSLKYDLIIVFVFRGNQSRRKTELAPEDTRLVFWFR